MSDPFLGQIIMFAGSFPPRGWAFCDGTLLPISNNQALFSLLGTTYGGDGRTTFALPDLRGRVPIGFGQGSGLSNYNQGINGGQETVVLTANQIPSHTHLLYGISEEDNSRDPTNNFLSKPNVEIYNSSTTNLVSMNAVAIGTTGGTAHENRQPSLGINFIISLEGTFPSRN